MSVVLDIGADVGALVLYAPASMDGQEIQITGSRHTHSVVRRRDTHVYAAVYPDLPAGDYTIWSDSGDPVVTTTITGGRVTTCRWPD